jgi:hypothetical protein
MEFPFLTLAAWALVGSAGGRNTVVLRANLEVHLHRFLAGNKRPF